MRYGCDVVALKVEDIAPGLIHRSNASLFDQLDSAGE
jgi:hypothetical protein